MAIDDDFILFQNEKKCAFIQMGKKSQKSEHYKYLLNNQNHEIQFNENELHVIKNRNASHPIRLQFLNTSSQTNLVPLGPINHSHYEHLWYQNIYNGIDTLFYVKNGYLEQDFIIKPNINPENIQFTILGASHFGIDIEGNLTIEIESNKFKLLKPISYQQLNGVKTVIESKYCLYDERIIGFEIGTYDTNFPLIIDPVFDFSMHLKHDFISEDKLIYNKFNNGTAITSDSFGNIYVLTTETTYVEANFVEKNSSHTTTYKGFLVVRKFDSSGKQIGDDIILLENLKNSVTLAAIGSDIAVDNEGNIYVIGSIMDPIKVLVALFKQVPIIGDILVFILVAIILGFDYEKPTNNIITPTKEALLDQVTGIITSFVIKIAPDYSKTKKVLASTYIGGDPGKITKPEKEKILAELFKGEFNTLQEVMKKNMMDMTFANKVKADHIGNVWITGSTCSKRISYATNKIHGDRHDAFVMKLNPEFTKATSFYFIGGELSDFGLSLTLNETKNSDDYEVFVVGAAEVDMNLTSNNTPAIKGKFETLNTDQQTLKPNATSGSFIAKFLSSGTPEYITLFSGNHGETIVNDVIYKEDGSLYIIGSTQGGVPILKSSYQKTHLFSPIQYVGFISKIDANEQHVIASTYLGGSKDYTGNGSSIILSFLPYISGSGGDLNTGNRSILKSIAIDGNGYIYVAGESQSHDFPMTNEAYQPVLLGRSDCILAKLTSDLSQLEYSTYFGGEDVDRVNQILVDESGNMYGIGQTASRNFPVSISEYPVESKTSSMFFKIPTKQNENTVEFLDSNLKIAINRIINHDLIDEITESDLLSMPRVIDLSSNQITNLTGLDKAKYLMGLYLQENQIEEVQLLSNLKELNFINLATNNISDLSELNFVSDGYFSNQTIGVSVRMISGKATLKVNFLKHLVGEISIIGDISDNGTYNETTHTITWNQVSQGQMFTFNFGHPVGVQYSSDETFNGIVQVTII
ncbi:MAG TPA: hypothetical protein DCY20_00185 [Firmicutes bacterium]|nr:hypothetical protein [Bacillota bacterium]